MRATTAALCLALSTPGCVGGASLVGVTLRNVAALFTPMRRVAHRVTRPARDDARIAVLWVGHATVLLQLDDRFVLTDPVFTSAVGQISPRLVEPGIDPDDLPRLDVALISHVHFDHLSHGSLALLAPRLAHVVMPAGTLPYAPREPPSSELATWETWEDRGLRVTAVPVRHDGGRYGADASWMGDGATAYVIEYRGLVVYFGGDSAYARDAFVATARRFPRIDLALLPIAPIAPRARHGPRHMDPAEALQAFTDLGAARMVPIHFDTFINSADRVGDAPAALRRAMAQRGLGADRVLLLEIGEQRVVVARGPSASVVRAAPQAMGDVASSSP